MEQMTNEEFHRILDNYLEGKATLEEVRILEAFYQSKADDLSPLSDWTPEEKRTAKSSIQQHLNKQIRDDQGARVPVIRWVGIAASVAFLIGATVWLSLNPIQFSDQSTEMAVVNYVTKSTKRGQKATITLNDGTVVRLNSESSITFPEHFDGESRSVVLEGEAFFEVAYNPEQPFTVRSGDLRTTVLGTSFNIAAFPEQEEIQVTVATGKVKVSNESSATAQALHLIPGEQASFNKTTTDLFKQEVTLETFLAWKDNRLVFDDISFAKAIHVLERWFDVQITLEEPAEARQCFVSGKFNNETLINVMDGLQFMKGFDYEVDNQRQITITGNLCN
jgi:transmembrane sensor